VNRFAIRWIEETSSSSLNLAHKLHSIVMIIITGDRRSGTSVWMQILQGGGFQILGEMFPAHWKDLMEQANPKGFYESTLVQGINYHTNPDPNSGAWIPPDKVTRVGVKIFADGLVKTDYAYITNVIFTIRKWQECAASQVRMDEIRTKSSAPDGIEPNAERAQELPPGFRWWQANFSIIKDTRTRRYPAAVFSYAALLENPEKIIGAAFKWLGGGNAAAAVSVVEQSLRTQKNIRLPNIDHDYSEVFDEFYNTLHSNQQITPAFYAKLVETDKKISQEIRAILASK